MRWLPWCIVTILLALVVGAATLGVVNSPGVGPSRPAQPVAEPARLRSFGLLPASPALTDRLVLKSHRVVAGTPISGTLIVTNSASHAINLTHRCTPSIQVGLTKNPHVAPAMAWTLECGTRPFLIRPGTNRLHFTVDTTYLQCVEDGGASVTPEVHCLPPPNVMPPLPVGRYYAAMVGDGIALPAPGAVAVTLLR